MELLHRRPGVMSDCPIFTSKSCSDDKEMYKKRVARAKLLFCLTKLLLFDVLGVADAVVGVAKAR